MIYFSLPTQRLLANRELTNRLYQEILMNIVRIQSKKCMQELEGDEPMNKVKLT